MASQHFILNEKGFTPPAIPSTPSQAHTNIQSSNGWLPHYESSVNDNLRNFGDAEAQHTAHSFDQTQEPKRRPKSKTKRYLFLAAFIGVPLVLIAIVAAAVVSTARHTEAQPRSTPVMLGDANSTQTVTQVMLEASTTSSSSSPLATVTVTDFLTSSSILSSPTETVTVTAANSQPASSAILPLGISIFTTTVTTSGESVTTAVSLLSAEVVAPTRLTAEPSSSPATDISTSSLDIMQMSAMPSSATSRTAGHTIIGRPEGLKTSDLAETKSTPLSSSIPTSTLSTANASPTTLKTAPKTTATSVLGGFVSFCGAPGTSCQEKRGLENEN